MRALSSPRLSIAPPAHVKRLAAQGQRQKAASGPSASHASGWLPPDAWLPAAAAALPSVDVDTLPSYERLLQDVLISSPGLLSRNPAAAAACVWRLECCMRQSAVWFGPALVTALLERWEAPGQVDEFLQQLLSVWLEHGQTPNTFGLLWLEASPAALLRGADAFAEQLAALQQALPDVPAPELLLSSPMLAGYLLSLEAATLQAQLAGRVLRQAGFLIIAPHARHLETITEPCSSGGRVTSVYGCCDSGMGDSSSAGQRELLMQLDARTDPDARLMPVLVLPLEQQLGWQRRQALL